MNNIKLGDIATFRAGYGFPTRLQGNSSGDYPFAKVGDISNVARAGKQYIKEARNFISVVEGKSIKAKPIPKGSIVFAKIGEAIRQNFRAITDCPMFIDNNTMGVIPNPDKVDLKYLFYFMQTLNLIQYSGATTVPAIRKSTLETISIPLPLLPEQKRIAAILDKADTIRQKRQKSIQLADDFLRATFLDMFGDPATNLKEWEWGTIRDLVTEAKYGTSQKAHVSEGEYPILRMNNITNEGQLNTSDLKYITLPDKDKPKYLVKKGDLLFNRTNSKELVGKTTVYNLDNPMALAGYIIRVRANQRANTQYISGYLNSNHGKLTLLNMCKSIVGMANINAQELQDIKILIPPVDLQNKYAAIVETVSSKKKTLIQAESQANELFKSLTQNAFTGRL